MKYDYLYNDVNRRVANSFKTLLQRDVVKFARKRIVPSGAPNTAQAASLKASLLFASFLIGFANIILRVFGFALQRPAVSSPVPKKNSDFHNKVLAVSCGLLFSIFFGSLTLRWEQRRAALAPHHIVQYLGVKKITDFWTTNPAVIQYYTSLPRGDQVPLDAWNYSTNFGGVK